MSVTRRRILTRLMPVAVLAACSPDPEPSGPAIPEVPLLVVSTTSFAASLVHTIGAEAVDSQCLLKSGISPHNYQPTAADLSLLQRCDLLIVHGLGLEDKWGLNLDALRSSGVKVMEIAPGIPADQLIHLNDPAGPVDPHVWMDPRLAAAMSRRVGEILKASLPKLETWLQQRSHETAVRLEDNYRKTLRKLEALPEAERFLFTSHDTMRYFARAYKLEARSLATANGLAEKAMAQDLLDWLTRNKVRTMFREQETDLTGLRKLLGEYKIKPDQVIYSLSLAPPAVTHLTSVSVLHLNQIVDALRYNADVISDTLITD